MAKPNETDRWAVGLESEPKQFWMIAVGTKAKTFTWWSRNLKFEFQLHSSGLWGK